LKPSPARLQICLTCPRVADSGLVATVPLKGAEWKHHLLLKLDLNISLDASYMKKGEKLEPKRNSQG
jgi:hypothetical protein